MQKTAVLAFSDSHNYEQGPEFLKSLIKDHSPDAVLAVGDLTTRGPLDYAQKLLAAASEAGVRVLAEGGNMDPADVHDWLEIEGLSMHAKKISLGDFAVVGVGGSLTTPFGTPTEYTEGQLAGFASGLVDGRTVFAPHNPPFNTCADLTDEGHHVGSKAIREVIEKSQPVVCLCGHIHEAKGMEFIGKTKLVKIQPLMWRKAVLLELPSLKVTFIGD